PDAYTLDYEQALDITEAVVSNLDITRFHDVIARGARRTSTFTFRLDYLSFDAFVKDWTGGEQSEYLDAASASPGYSVLAKYFQAQNNAAYRSDDRLRNVFRRFVMNPDWGGLIPDWHSEDATLYLWSPIV